MKESCVQPFSFITILSHDNIPSKYISIIFCLLYFSKQCLLPLGLLPHLCTISSCHYLPVLSVNVMTISPQTFLCNQLAITQVIASLPSLDKHAKLIHTAYNVMWLSVYTSDPVISNISFNFAFLSKWYDLTFVATLTFICSRWYS